MDTTPVFGFRIPSADGSDTANLATLLRNLGLDVEGKGGGITAMTSAARSARTGAGKYEGRMVYETDTDLLWRSDGTNWQQLVLLDSSGHLPMAGKKVTGLAAGSASTDAATKGQVDAAKTHCLGSRPAAAALSIPDATVTTLTYTTETDPSNILNPGSGVITVPTAGVWALNAQVNFTTDYYGFTDFYIRNIGTGEVYARQRFNNNALTIGDQCANLAAILPLAASTTLDVRVYQDSDTGRSAFGHFAAALLGAV
jgi:hypothetical protein